MNTDLKSDLAYVRALAEEGRDTPLVGGVMYVVWGGLIGAASLMGYARAIGWLDFGFFGGLSSWVAAIALGWAFSMFLGRRAGSKPGASTLGNRTAMAVWFSVGLFMTGFWITMMFVHDDFTSIGVPPGFLFGLMFPLAFGLYGVAFFATAVAGRAGWLKWFALIAWICSAASLVLMNSPHHLLVGAIGSVLCAIVPGAIMMRNEPSEIV